MLHEFLDFLISVVNIVFTIVVFNLSELLLKGSHAFVDLSLPFDMAAPYLRFLLNIGGYGL
jgi:hypothetical protein